MSGKCAATSSFTLCAATPARRVFDRLPPILAPPPVPGSAADRFGITDGHRSFGCGHRK